MPSRVRLPGTYQTVTVMVPPGKLAGSRLVVQAGGRLLTAVVPRGLAAGDSFTIDVPIERTRKEKLRAMPSQIAAVARLLAEKIADNAPRILRKVSADVVLLSSHVFCGCDPSSGVSTMSLSSLCLLRADLNTHG
eukprot:SAG31_NODE_16269_length_716_cov_0.777958_1_plen_134_part_10